MLKINNLTFYYNQKFPLLENLNFSIDHGEFVYLIGKSGSGKTTLFQLIYMNLFPVSGLIEIGNYSSETMRNKDIPYLRRQLGIVFQDFKLLDNRTVSENLEFVLRVTGVRRKEISKRVDEVLESVGLMAKKNQYPGNLSGGEKQRVAIARALINDPLLILADEPTGNLDPETSEEIITTLKNINKRGKSVLMATHNYNLLVEENARVYRLAAGKINSVIVKKKNS
ncbi:MAG: ATP-binding cassette domain-containing protein [Ignavibacteriales bacterium]|nr:ATP-binding cassette domain-containing protein [Ignavibacteriales bacterium]